MTNLKERIEAVEATNMSLAELNKVMVKTIMWAIAELNEKVELLMDGLGAHIVEEPASKSVVFVWESFDYDDEDDDDDEDCDCWDDVVEEARFNAQSKSKKKSARK